MMRLSLCASPFSSLLLLIILDYISNHQHVVLSFTLTTQRRKHQRLNRHNTLRHPRNKPYQHQNTLLHATPHPTKNIVIIGGGWAGFTAASTLSTLPDANVTLLDASRNPRGGLAGGWRTPTTNRSVEAGIHGFWREYENTFRVMERDIGLNVDEVLTDWTPSVLVSERGRVAVAPVIMAEGRESGGGALPTPSELIGAVASGNATTILSLLAPLLPPPLDLALLSPFSSQLLTPLDRVSALSLLPHWADFVPDSRASWRRYDALSAEELFFEMAGVSKPLYEELVSPLLHVLPMAPGYDVSAAATLSCFHFFGMRSKGAFDVRWGRGSLADVIFDPWVRVLEGRGVDVRGGARVTMVERGEEGGWVVSCDGGGEGDDYELTADAVVMAVGGPSMGRLSLTSPVLKSLPYAFEKCRGVTCVAVRLFLRPDGEPVLPLKVRQAMSDSPVFVCGPNLGGDPLLRETGFCIYDLQRLQRGWDDVAVLEVDYFRADDLADLSDDEIVNVTLKAIAVALGLKTNDGTLLFSKDEIIDQSVVRARNAVSHFDVGSASLSPDIRLTNDGLYACGDWIDRTGHASWSTEKSVVTGRQVGNALARDFGLATTDVEMVLDVVEETRELKALRTVARGLRTLLPPEGGDNGVPLSPLAFARNAFGLKSSLGNKR